MTTTKMPAARRRLSMAGLLAAPFAAGAMAAAATPGTIGVSADNCTALIQFHVPGVSMTIEKATVVPAGIPAPIPFAPPFHTMVPAYCRADGTLDSRTGRDGKPYAIRFAIALPEKWNGRFLFQGGGGLNGSVLPPLGYQATGDTLALARGFAVVSTDTGHQSATPFDVGFLSDQEATINFLYQANAKVAPVAKQIRYRSSRSFGRTTRISTIRSSSLDGILHVPERRQPCRRIT